MELKYELTDETRIIENGCIVHRIRAICGIIVNGKKIVSEGEFGGWVERTDNLSHGNAWLYGNAQVYVDAWVCDDVIKSCDRV